VSPDRFSTASLGTSKVRIASPAQDCVHRQKTKKRPSWPLFYLPDGGDGREPAGSTKRASVLDARSAPQRGEDRLRAIRINPTLSARQSGIHRLGALGPYYSALLAKVSAAVSGSARSGGREAEILSLGRTHFPGYPTGIRIYYAVIVIDWVNFLATADSIHLPDFCKLMRRRSIDRVEHHLGKAPH